jgi:hypothetical protein
MSKSSRAALPVVGSRTIEESNQMPVRAIFQIGWGRAIRMLSKRCKSNNQATSEAQPLFGQGETMRADLVS